MKTTDELLKVLKNSQDINQFVQENVADINGLTFLESLNESLENSGMTKALVIEKSNIQKNYCYQIFDGSKTPSRDKVLALSIAMKLSVKDTNRLLKLSDHSILYPRIKRDSIIQFAIEQKCSLIDTNILLHDMRENIID